MLRIWIAFDRHLSGADGFGGAIKLAHYRNLGIAVTFLARKAPSELTR